MQLERSRNAKRGMIFGLINKFVLLILPFFLQTVMIRSLGADYLGIKGLFSAILQVFSLAELGIGTAIVYSMYKPIATGNTDEICALLSLYKRFYTYIGMIVFTIGLLLTPFVPKLINGECPKDINLTVIYIMYLSNTVLSYWLFAYRTSLFTAFQRTDIISNISTISMGGSFVIQILVLYILKNYYLYLSVSILSTILNNLLVYFLSKKYFPNYECKGKVSKEIKEEIKEKVMGLMIYKICGTTRNSFDSIFISMYLGLTVTAMYTNYFYIITAVTALLGVVNSSLTAGVGNSMKLDTVEKNMTDMRFLDCIYMTISGACMTFIICLFQPFIEIWVGKEFLFPNSIAVLFGVYFYIQKMGDIRALYADAAGLWWENRYRTVLESVSNIILNYVFVRIWGIRGIIGATIITLFVFGYGCSAVVLFKSYFKESPKMYYISHICYASVAMFVCLISYRICLLFAGNIWLVLFARIIICLICIFFLYGIIFIMVKPYRDALLWSLSKIRRM